MPVIIPNSQSEGTTQLLDMLGRSVQSIMQQKKQQGQLDLQNRQIGLSEKKFDASEEERKRKKLASDALLNQIYSTEQAAPRQFSGMGDVQGPLSEQQVQGAEGIRQERLDELASKYGNVTGKLPFTAGGLKQARDTRSTGIGGKDYGKRLEFEKELIKARSEAPPTEYQGFLMEQGGERSDIAKSKLGIDYGKLDLAKKKHGLSERETGLNEQKTGIVTEKWQREKAKEADKKQKRKEGINLAAQTVVEDLGRGIDILEKNRDNLVTTAAGPLAIIAKAIPATDADKLQKFTESVKSNISIDRLQAMREASPTGGALGQVPVQQQEYLMQLLGSLDVAQQPQVLEDNMKRIYNIYLDIIHGGGNGPKDGFRYKLSFDELGRPLQGGRNWTETPSGQQESPNTQQQQATPQTQIDTQGLRSKYQY